MPGKSFNEGTDTCRATLAQHGISNKFCQEDPKGKTIVVTVTGNGLKDVQWVLNSAGKPIVIPVDMKRAAKVIGLK